MKLMPHQIEDARFLASRRRAACFSGMGTGKTRTALEAARLADATRPLVIVAPPVALRMWEEEARDHLGLEIQIIKTVRQRIGPAPVIIMSYDIATKRRAELAELPARGRPTFSGHCLNTAVIWDESHALKSVDAQRTKAALGRSGYGREFGHAWLLSGTPIVRHADDLWPALCFAHGRALVEAIGGDRPDFERFALRFLVRQTKQYHPRMKPQRVVVGSVNASQLRDLVYGVYGEGGFAVRRELHDVMQNLPALTERHLHLGLSKIEGLDKVTKLSAAEARELIESGGEALSTARRLLGEAKVAAAATWARSEVEDGNSPLLIFAWHRSVIEGLAAALREGEDMVIETLDGSTSSAHRDDIVERWTDGEIDVLIAQTGAAGVSLNLQRAGHRCAFLESDWSPGVMDQAIARLRRIGQKSDHVQVDYLDADVKLDSVIHAVAGRKAAFASRSVEGQHTGENQ